MGKKINKKIKLKEKAESHWSSNCSAPARNLRKSDLGAVIFGCKNNTIAECHSKLLFGLPAPHIAYVRNISSGLPLFLFNYSDRKLHGVYEATSQGQLNINPYGWTVDGEVYTAYPAQVRVQVRVQSRPLSEEEFKPVIANNYYEPRLFWFELDQAQTHKLISMFMACSGASRPPNFSMQNGRPTSNLGQKSEDSRRQVSQGIFFPLNANNVGWGASCDVPGSEEGWEVVRQRADFKRSFSSIVSGTKALLPEKNCNSSTGRKWSSLFETSNSFNSIKDDEVNEDPASKMNLKEFNAEWGSLHDIPPQEKENQDHEAWDPKSDWGNNEVEWGDPDDLAALGFQSSCETTAGVNEWGLEAGWGNDRAEWRAPNDVAVPKFQTSGEAIAGVNEWDSKPDCGSDGAELGPPNNLVAPVLQSFSEATAGVNEWDSEPDCGNDGVELGAPNNLVALVFQSFSEAMVGVDEWDDGVEVKAASSECNLLCSKETKADDTPSSATPRTPFLDNNDLPESSSVDDDVIEPDEQTFQPEANSENCSFSSAQIEIGLKTNNGEDSVFAFARGEELQIDVSVRKSIPLAEMTSSDISSLVMMLVGEVEEMKVSHQKINSLQQELVESKDEILFLKNRCHVLEHRLFSLTGQVEEAVTECNDSNPWISDSILIVGGNAGPSWVPDLCSYSPSNDTSRSLSPMPFVRQYAAATALNGELYVFGGVDGGLWHDTVVSYDPVDDQWISRSKLNQKRGSLAGASLGGKLFAIGGRDGNECLSSVEMLDCNIGKWIRTKSMVHKRFASAAAEFNGALYVVGGYDGISYMSSVERFDPREHAWTSLTSMKTKRGCHSVVVLNDKLHALGGFNEHEMVSSTEIFDPRNETWMEGKNLNTPRGYFGAAVLGEKLYIIGGVNAHGEILDSVECYEERGSWEETNLKGVGKRCYFSAVVL